MRKLIQLSFILFPLAFSSCEIENEDDNGSKNCEKIWEVIINNPEAMVELKGGDLVITIPNPTSTKDVRLIQKQTKYYPDQGVNLYMKYSGLTSKYGGGELIDPMVSTWFAYQYNPDSAVLALKTGKFGSRLEYNNTYRQHTVGSIENAASSANIIMEAHNSLDADVELDVSPGGLGFMEPDFSFEPNPMNFYIDIGVNPIYFDRYRTNKESSTYHSDKISVRIQEVKFVKTAGGLELNEFKNDEFDCNSLQY